MSIQRVERLGTLWVFFVVEMDDLNRHATCSRILRNLLRKNRGNDASGDGYRALVEVHGVKVYVQHFGSEDRVKDRVWSWC